MTTCNYVAKQMEMEHEQQVAKKQETAKITVNSNYVNWSWSDASKARKYYILVNKSALPELTAFLKEADAINRPLAEKRQQALYLVEEEYSTAIEPVYQKLQELLKRITIREGD